MFFTCREPWTLNFRNVEHYFFISRSHTKSLLCRIIRTKTLRLNVLKFFMIFNCPFYMILQLTRKIFLTVVANCSLNQTQFFSIEMEPLPVSRINVPVVSIRHRQFGNSAFCLDTLALEMWQHCSLLIFPFLHHVNL